MKTKLTEQILDWDSPHNLDGVKPWLKLQVSNSLT